MEIVDGLEFFLDKFYNTITFTISLAALIVSSIALRYSRMQPSLEIVYAVHQSDNGYFKNGKGKLEFLVDRETNQISLVRPKTSLDLILLNNGKVSAKYPAIFMRFNGFQINNTFNENWETTHHVHGIGTWQGIKWEPKENTILHPGIPKEFYELSFSYAEIEQLNDKSASIDITIVADGFKAKTMNIPVEFEIL